MPGLVAPSTDKAGDMQGRAIRGAGVGDTYEDVVGHGGGVGDASVAQRGRRKVAVVEEGVARRHGAR